MGKVSRRGFLSFLGGAAAIAAVDPEKLLWTPGKRTISIPAPIRAQYLLSATFDFAAGDEYLSLSDFEDRYMRPAMSALTRQLDAAMLKRYRFEDLLLPGGWDIARRGPLGPFPNVREGRGYDIVSNRRFHRFDALVVSGG